MSLKSVLGKARLHYKKYERKMLNKLVRQGGNMEEIKCYKTSAGKIFESLIDAIRQEKEISLKKRINLWVDKYCWNGISKSDLEDYLFETRDEITQIFSLESTITDKEEI